MPLSVFTICYIDHLPSPQMVNPGRKCVVPSANGKTSTGCRSAAIGCLPTPFCSGLTLPRSELATQNGATLPIQQAGSMIIPAKANSLPLLLVATLPLLVDAPGSCTPNACGVPICLPVTVRLARKFRALRARPLPQPSRDAGPVPRQRLAASGLRLCARAGLTAPRPFRYPERKRS